jgi:excisionase family DNA binding protein
VPEINSAVDHRYATVGEAAHYVKVHERTIREWIRAGRLTGYRFAPQTLRVDLAQLDALGGGA